MWGARLCTLVKREGFSVSATDAKGLTVHPWIRNSLVIHAKACQTQNTSASRPGKGCYPMFLSTTQPSVWGKRADSNNESRVPKAYDHYRNPFLLNYQLRYFYRPALISNMLFLKNKVDTLQQWVMGTHGCTVSMGIHTLSRAHCSICHKNALKSPSFLDM